MDSVSIVVSPNETIDDLRKSIGKATDKAFPGAECNPQDLILTQIDEDLIAMDKAVGTGLRPTPDHSPTIAEYTNSFQCVASIASQGLRPAPCVCSR